MFTNGTFFLLLAFYEGEAMSFFDEGGKKLRLQKERSEVNIWT
jgi:hypothetical protein